jgi:acetoin utilization protein AcuB
MRLQKGTWAVNDGPPQLGMNVVDVMTNNPITIRGDKSLRAALELMHEHQFKHLPVISAQNHLIGVLSDRDCRHALNSPFILHERWQDEELTRTVTVRSVMTPAPIVVEPHQSADEAARLMLTHRIGCLPVMLVESLVGIVTRSDMLIAFMNMHRHYEMLGQAFPPIEKDIAEPSTKKRKK